MTEISARQRDFFDRQVVSLIKMKYGMEDMKAIRSFLFSETYQMLLDPLTEVYTFSPQIVFEMWESEMITGNPRNSQYIRGEFFIYLLERYADFKKQKASDILKLWDEVDLTKLIYDLYEIYHVERLENAFEDIDTLLKERTGAELSRYAGTKK